MRNLKIVCFKKGVRKIKFLIILWIWLITGCSLPVNRTVEQDKAWYADRDPNTNEPKTTIHERLEINKRIIQEKQGKDKPERGADLGVR